MRKRGLALVLVALVAASARARQSLAAGSQDGPLSVTPPEAAPAPRPFSDGTYAPGPGITAPKISKAVPAVYPADAPGASSKSVCILSLVIGSDGLPAKVHVIRSAGDVWDAAAIEAVKQSSFEPGSLNQQPVPVRTYVRVAFSADRNPALPTVLQLRYRDPGSGTILDSPPTAIHIAEPLYSDEARRKKIQGIVIVSVLVTEEGLPTEMRVERSLGYGLDEKALEAAGQYRFRPATKEGKPVATRISIEMNFRLY